MRRVQTQLDETTYLMLKNRAWAQERSIASLVRDAVSEYLTPSIKRRPKLSDLTFVGAGRSDPNDPRSGSVHHDDIWAETILEEHRNC